MGRGQLKCDGTCAETRFRLSAKRTSPFKSAGASVQSTTGSRCVRISGSNAGYTMFRGSVKSIGYPLHSPVSLSLPLPASSCAITFQLDSTGPFPGVKRPGRGVDHPLSPSAEVKERVELYIYSPFGPLWPVQVWTLPLPFTWDRKGESPNCTIDHCSASATCRADINRPPKGTSPPYSASFCDSCSSCTHGYMWLPWPVVMSLTQTVLAI